MSYVSCILDCESLDDNEKSIMKTIFPSARELVILPVWSSFQTPCYEHFCCQYAQCPAYGLKEIRCWTIDSTYCKDGYIHRGNEKILHCIRCDMFMPVGLVVCDITRSSNNSSPIELDDIIGILNAASLAISNARLYERTLELSELDSLTGIKNRRTFFKTLSVEMVRVKRYIKQFGIIMIDIDKFKQYNDTNGHPQGDILLRMFTSTIKHNLRETDVLGRYGGEEFIVLLPETSKDDAIALAERLRVAVEQEHFSNAEKQPGGRVIASLGVSCYPGNGSTIEELIKAADKALYNAKKAEETELCWHR